MNRAPEICFDRILPTSTMRLRNLPDRGVVSAISPIGKAWPNGSTLRIRWLGGTIAQRALALVQAQWWAAACNVTFAESTALDAEIRCSFNAADGAWSYIGTDCGYVPQGEATMNLGFQTGGTSGHEFGHAIGLAHEHQSPNGGIQWNEAEVIRDLAGAPNFWTAEQTRQNVLLKYTADQVKGTAFDPKSIMLYAFPARWTLNGIGTSANDVLSPVDQAFTATLYPRAAVPPQTNRLVVGAVPLQAEIRPAGEEDLYALQVTVPGRYAVETGGTTDVVMRLFGPNSSTSLLAEDDDSGPGLNSRIAIGLLAGAYVVQVRHYNHANGVGKYTISVRR